MNSLLIIGCVEFLFILFFYVFIDDCSTASEKEQDGWTERHKVSAPLCLLSAGKNNKHNYCYKNSTLKLYFFNIFMFRESFKLCISRNAASSLGQIIENNTF